MNKHMSTTISKIGDIQIIFNTTVTFEGDKTTVSTSFNHNDMSYNIILDNDEFNTLAVYHRWGTQNSEYGNAVSHGEEDNDEDFVLVFHNDEKRREFATLVSEHIQRCLVACISEHRHDLITYSANFLRRYENTANHLYLIQVHVCKFIVKHSFLYDISSFSIVQWDKIDVKQEII